MAEQIHTISFSTEDYQKAAEKWDKQLLLMPLFSAQETLKYMKGIPGVRNAMHIGTAESNAQFAPYKARRVSAGDTEVIYRELRTYFGNVVEKFEPDAYISYLLGEGADFLGEGQKNAPSAKLVLATVMMALGHNLEAALFSASRDASGDTTMDLFDGWGTIADAEITAENISVAKGNLLELDEAITDVNAVDVAKQILFSLDPRLRQQNLFLYCSQDFVDKYNEAYLATHNGIIYNTQYNQPFVEGSNQKLTLAPLPCLTDTDKFFVSSRDNMLYGYDNMSDVERIVVKDYEPFVLTLAAAMFFGVQFRSIDKRMLKVVKLAAAASGGNGGSSSGNEGGGSAANGGESGGSGSGTTTVTPTKVATPTFSPDSWTEGETLTVELATETDGASIYYTDDGTTPTSESTAYDSTNKITLSATKTIKAIAVKSEMTDSDVATKEYTKPD